MPLEQTVRVDLWFDLKTAKPTSILLSFRNNSRRTVRRWCDYFNFVAGRRRDAVAFAGIVNNEWAPVSSLTLPRNPSKLIDLIIARQRQAPK